jgi:hypothetical protein
MNSVLKEQRIGSTQFKIGAVTRLDERETNTISTTRFPQRMPVRNSKMTVKRGNITTRLVLVATVQMRGSIARAVGVVVKVRDAVIGDIRVVQESVEDLHNAKE